MSFNIGAIDVTYTPLNPPEKCPTYRGLKVESRTLDKGHRESPDRAPFAAETVWDRDFEIPLRDRVRLRADIFRPSKAGKVPALVVWGPYGKTGQGFLNLGLIPGRAGVSLGRTSGLESFEGLDPAEWTARGYAICNVDSRGSFDSESDMRWWGTAEGRDGYDAVQCLASLPWCNGNVGMVGNSWLAISQYFIAAEQPPHLRCIAPLEGASDVYRENLCRGGIPQPAFARTIAGGMFGRSQQEDLATMLGRFPTYNEYWEDKRAKFEKVKIPTYVLASYSSGLHGEGSVRAFKQIAAPKWLRIHPYQEWYDLYAHETTEELQKFFDRYLKGLKNDWEKTPAVRVSILRFDKDPLINHVFEDYPVPSTDYTKMYLTASGDLTDKQPEQTGSLSYQADANYEQMDNDEEELQFKYTFGKATNLVGYPKAVLYMQTHLHDDMDVYVQIRKADKYGKTLRHINIPLKDLGLAEKEVPLTNVLAYLGPTGMIRASHRAIDSDLSDPHHAVLSHREIQKIQPGEVVKLEIPIWPGGIAFEAGESLIVKISGHEMRLAEFDFLRGKGETGKGKNTVCCGEDGHFSYVVLPFVEL